MLDITSPPVYITLIVLGIGIMICCVLSIYCLNNTHIPEQNVRNQFHFVINMPDVNEYVKKHNTHCILCKKILSGSMIYNKCGHNFHMDCKEKWEILGPQYLKQLNKAINEVERNACLKCPNCYSKYLDLEKDSFIDCVNSNKIYKK